MCDTKVSRYLYYWNPLIRRWSSVVSWVFDVRKDVQMFKCLERMHSAGVLPVLVLFALLVQGCLRTRLAPIALALNCKKKSRWPFRGYRLIFLRQSKLARLSDFKCDLSEECESSVPSCRFMKRGERNEVEFTALQVKYSFIFFYYLSLSQCSFVVFYHVRLLSLLPLVRISRGTCIILRIVMSCSMVS